MIVIVMMIVVLVVMMIVVLVMMMIVVKVNVPTPPLPNRSRFWAWELVKCCWRGFTLPRLINARYSLIQYVS